MEEKKPCVVLGVFTRGRDIHYRLIEFIIHQVLCQKYRVAVLYSESKTSAPMTFMGMWKKAPTVPFDYILCMDSDVILPLNALDEMIKHKKDVMIPPIWYCDSLTQDICIGAHPTDDKRRIYYPPPYGIEKIGAGHVSACLISRRTYDIFEKRKESPVEWSPLIDEWYKDRLTDNVFYAKLRKLGIQAWVNWDIKDVTHLTEVALNTKTIERTAEFWTKHKKDFKKSFKPIRRKSSKRSRKS
jgi:hypothetical protein